MSNAPIRQADIAEAEEGEGKPGSRRVTRRLKGTERLTLRGVREGMGKTQTEVAVAMGTDQGEVSRIEKRSDVLLSTLRRYASAIGAQCELVLVFPTGHRVPIADPEPADPTK